MIYTNFTVGEKEYKLRLSTQNTVLLEKAIGCPSTAIFGNGDTLPTFTVLVTVIHYSMLQLQHGLTISDTYSIIDEWIAEGHNQVELIPIIIEVYKNSGLLPRDDEKN